MANRPCLDCGKLGPKSRCVDCNRGWERTRKPSPTNLARNRAERMRRAQAVADHREQHGDWCPGWKRDPHHSTDLTADHVQAVGAGGSPAGPLTVLCRPCNSAKGAKGPGAGPTPA